MPVRHDSHRLSYSPDTALTGFLCLFAVDRIFQLFPTEIAVTGAFRSCSFPYPAPPLLPAPHQSSALFALRIPCSCGRSSSLLADLLTRGVVPLCVSSLCRRDRVRDRGRHVPLAVRAHPPAHHHRAAHLPRLRPR